MPYDAMTSVEYVRLTKPAVAFPVEDKLIALLQEKPKKLHTSLGYDPEGSEIYERLCIQPDYYLTRTERKLLERESEGIVKQANPSQIIDLGCGNFEKTQILLHECRKHVGEFEFVPCDIDNEIIQSCLPHLLHFYKTGMRVHALVGAFEDCFSYLEKSSGQRLFCFLGSTIGNLTDEERTDFLKGLAKCMDDDDTFLIGLDLVKAPYVLEAAYNDGAGILRRTVFQMLVNLNRTYEAEFDLSLFDHVAKFEPEARRVASYLISKVNQRVPIKALGIEVDLAAGEPIEAEFYRKFVLQEFLDELEEYDFLPVRVVVDEKKPYALLVVRKMTQDQKAGLAK